MNLNLDDNIVLISHTDLDGYGSEIVLRALGYNPTVYHLENQEVDGFLRRYLDDMLDHKKEIPAALFLTDLSPNEENAEKLNLLHRQGLKHMYLFDHHQTALSLNQYSWALVLPESNDGVKQCGTSLFYCFLAENMGIKLDEYSKLILDRVVELIRLYDTWEWEKEGVQEAKDLNTLFYLEGPDLFISNRLAHINDRSLKYEHFKEPWLPHEGDLLEIENNRMARYLKNKEQEMITITGFFTDEYGIPLTAGVVQADQYISELGHYLCNTHPEIDFALMLMLTKNKVSFRAVKEHINLIPIVKRYGGGGHKHAAGCDFIHLGKEFLDVLYDHVKIEKC
jgi:oligoribonuclease NrnB/cAMP/cGMP phosphodiesterase (DHH superfamily)